MARAARDDGRDDEPGRWCRRGVAGERRTPAGATVTEPTRKNPLGSGVSSTLTWVAAPAPVLVDGDGVADDIAWRDSPRQIVVGDQAGGLEGVEVGQLERHRCPRSAAARAGWDPIPADWWSGCWWRCWARRWGIRRIGQGNLELEGDDLARLHRVVGGRRNRVRRHGDGDDRRRRGRPRW